MNLIFAGYTGSKNQVETNPKIKIIQMHFSKIKCRSIKGLLWQAGKKFWKAITTLKEVLYFWEQVEKDKFVRVRDGIFFIGIYLPCRNINQTSWGVD